MTDRVANQSAIVKYQNPTIQQVQNNKDLEQIDEFSLSLSGASYVFFFLFFFVVVFLI